MGSTDLRFNYQDIDAMEKLLQNIANELQQTKTDVINVASSMEAGAFQSKPGEQLAESMKSVLAQSIERLKDRIEQNRQKLDQAGKEMQDFDKQGASGFSN